MHNALKISLIYLLVGLAWIYFSDTLILGLTGLSAQGLSEFQTAKGLFFIAITAILLFLLIHGSNIQKEQHLQDLKKNYKETDWLLVNKLPNAD